MRLTEKDIGKEVSDGNCFSPAWKKLLGICGNSIWVKPNLGDPFTSENHDNWLIKEPEKLPSEEIEYIFSSREITRIDAIIKWLDQQREKGKI